MGVREANKQDKRERLSRAARELFSQQGFDATTMRQIAERAGIGVGTIFLYARDKQGLLFLLFSDAVLDVQRRAFESLPQGDKAGMRSPSQSVLLEQLVHVFSSFYRYYESDRRLSRLFIKELLFLDSDPAGPQPNAHANANASGEAGQPGRAGASNSRVSDAETHVGLTLEFIGRLSGLVQQAQVRGELRADFDPLLATMNFFATYFLTLVGLLDPIAGAQQDAELATQRLRLALQLQISGLCSEAGPALSTSPSEAPRRRRPAARSAAERKRRTR